MIQWKVAWVCQFKNSIASSYIYDSLSSSTSILHITVAQWKRVLPILFIEMTTQLICSSVNEYFLQVHADANFDCVSDLSSIHKLNGVWIVMWNCDHYCPINKGSR